MDESMQQEISLKDLFLALWQQKILIIIITFLFAIIAFFGARFYYQNDRVMISNFEYDFSGVELDRYPDGSPFDYRSIISNENLEAVYESDNTYKIFELEDLQQNRSFYIQRQKSLASTNTVTVFETNQYTIQLPLSYFDFDTDLAKAFINDLVTRSYQIALSKSENIGIYDQTILINGDTEYLDEITLLKNQHQAIIKAYQELIEMTEDRVINDVRLSEILSEYQTIFDNTYDLNMLSSIISINGYYKDFETHQVLLNLRIEQIERQIDLNNQRYIETEKIYQDLVMTSNLQQADILLERLSTLKNDNVVLNQSKLDYEHVLEIGQTTNQNTYIDEDVKNLLLEIKAHVQLHTDEVNEIAQIIVDDENKLIYEDRVVAYEDGGMSTMMIALIALILGGIIAIVVALIKHYVFDEKDEVIKPVTVE